MRNYDYEVLISKNNDSLTKDDNKCISCGQCKKVCNNDITVAKMFEINPNREPICINCGQCSNICPTEAISERFSYLKVKKLLQNKNNKIIVFNVEPASLVSLKEAFDLDARVDIEKKIPSVLRKMGANYIFDITNTAYITVLEEANELANRIKNKINLPMFDCNCPSWVKYCEIFYPELIPNLSTTKSYITATGTIIKTYFADKIKVPCNDIINIVVTPCTARKSEIRKKKINYSKTDTNYVITTRELIKLIKDRNININNIKDSSYDISPKGIIGTSGNTCVAVIKEAYRILTGKYPNIELDSLYGTASTKELEISFEDKKIKIAVCNGMKSGVDLITKLLNKEIYYDFIEIMACNGGCTSGGGQPKITLLNMKDTKNRRMEEIDKVALKTDYKNKEIKYIIDNYNSLLHTEYYDKSYLLRGDDNEQK